MEIWFENMMGTMMEIEMKIVMMIGIRIWIEMGEKTVSSPKIEGNRYYYFNVLQLLKSSYTSLTVYVPLQNTN